ncbi:MAG: Rnase Y domain-containing protein, partial [Desulfatiglandales bacterium]
MIETIVISGACLFVGIGLGIFFFRRKAEGRLSEIEAEAQRILSKAEKEANDLRKDAALQAKDILFQAKLELDRETKEKKEQLQSLEKRLLHKEETLDRKMEQLERKESRLLERERALEKLEGELKRKEQEAERLLEEQQKKLEEIACISRDEAKAILIRSLEEEARQEAARIVRRIEAEAKEQADRKAQEILALAVKRYSGEYVAENTVSVVTLPNEEMKGRIIGREGRNIRAIEAATGVDIIIDDTPEAVILSAFNPIRREVARISLQRLIEDGRIHPGRIEEVVAKVDKEIEASI